MVDDDGQGFQGGAPAPVWRYWGWSRRLWVEQDGITAVFEDLGVLYCTEQKGGSGVRFDDSVEQSTTMALETAARAIEWRGNGLQWFYGCCLVCIWVSHLCWKWVDACFCALAARIRWVVFPSTASCTFEEFAFFVSLDPRQGTAGRPQAVR